MCKWGTTLPIRVIRKNNHLNEDGWHEIEVDACIAEYVQHMNNLGIITINCCCGHFKSPPSVLVDSQSESLMIQYRYSFSRYYYPDGSFCLEHIVQDIASNNDDYKEFKL